VLLPEAEHAVDEVHRQHGDADLGHSARKAMPPPTHSRIAMRWVNWERSFR